MRVEAAPLSHAAGFRGVGRVLVVTPTYNEAGSVRRHVTSVRRCVPEVEVLVVDDDSPDGTGRIADSLAGRDPAVHVLHRSRREGLGPAYVAGFRWALARDFDVIVEMDADGSHSATDLPRLLAASRRYDVVLGSRWVDGGSVRHWPMSRHLLSQTGNAYTRHVLGLPVRDPTGGFRAYRAHVLRAMRLEALASHGYAFQVETAWLALRLGASVCEVPITFEERTVGRSKMDGRIVAEAARLVTVWGVRQRLPGSRGRSRPHE